MTRLLIRRRSVAAAMVDSLYPGQGTFEERTVSYRWRWSAQLHAWAINTLGAGHLYEHAIILGGSHDH